MKNQKEIEWTRLDNASKIFPATWSIKDPKVFRLSCELNELIEPKELQTALDMSIEDHPLYKSVLRRGVFWYYLEKSDYKPEVGIESESVCTPIYTGHRYNLLFRVIYYKNRINLEVFHGLSDGAGALLFFQTLVHHYLTVRHREEFADTIPVNDKPPISGQMDNSFGKYFLGAGSKNREKKKAEEKAYRLHGAGNVDNRLSLIEGAMSAREVLNEAHKYHTTLTVFLSALYIYAIGKQMSVKDKKRPVVLTVPVNLRQFYESVTARNFFSYINIPYHFGKDPEELEALVEIIGERFKKYLTLEQLNDLSNKHLSIEQNLLTRLIPLQLKDLIIRLYVGSVNKQITTSLSNIGRIEMPPEFASYIRQFSVCTNAKRPQITLCSYGDRLVLSITSPFRETDLQRTFFQLLSQLGIQIEISSNL